MTAESLNPVLLYRRTEGNWPDDFRTRSGKPVKVGQIATLEFHPGGKMREKGYVKVEVTSVDGGTFRGKVVGTPSPLQTLPKKLPIGAELTFHMEHIFVLNNAVKAD